MGKVKEQMEYEEQLEFYLELCYQEWLEENTKKGKNVKLQKMMCDYLKPCNPESFLIYVSSVNNVEYQPVSGGG